VARASLLPGPADLFEGPPLPPHHGYAASAVHSPVVDQPATSRSPSGCSRSSCAHPHRPVRDSRGRRQRALGLATDPNSTTFGVKNWGEPLPLVLQSPMNDLTFPKGAIAHRAKCGPTYHGHLLNVALRSGSSSFSLVGSTCSPPKFSQRDFTRDGLVGRTVHHLSCPYPPDLNSNTNW